MSTFALKELEQVTGKINVFKLVIDGDCPFDNFLLEVEGDGNYKRKLFAIFSIIEQVANLRMMPKEKFKDITPNKELVKEFEVKKGELRVYLIKDTDGHLVILGGKKNRQKRDIKTFRGIKQRYLNSKG